MTIDGIVIGMCATGHGQWSQMLRAGLDAGLVRESGPAWHLAHNLKRMIDARAIRRVRRGWYEIA